ncbi:MAG: hypothetical protein ACWA44_06495 [Thiotrichales bacterium]
MQKYSRPVSRDAVRRQAPLTLTLSPEGERELLGGATVSARIYATINIALVGVVGLNLRRDDFFKKEITFQVSASYGPGRYDRLYEEQGQDYPVDFVRWTEQRNFEAVLDMMASGALDVKSLITHRFPIEQAIEAYKLLDDLSALGIVLEYPERPEAELRRSAVRVDGGSPLPKPSPPRGRGLSSGGEKRVIVGFVGAGNYASRALIPAFRDAGVALDTP